MPYDFNQIKSMMFPWIKRGNGLICTELVLKVFKEAGLPLLGNRTEKVTPNELKEALEKNKRWKLCHKISDGVDNV